MLLARALLHCIIGCISFFGFSSQLNAQSKYPPGGRLTIGVATTAGGGYDSYARLVGLHIPQYIPGKPTTVIANMTGAGGNVLGRYITNVAPRDGSWMALLLPSTITAGVYHDKAKLQYDPSRLVHIGSANSEVDMCFVRSDAGISNLVDARSKQVSLGATAFGGATREQPAVLNKLVGTKFKIVSGYPGTREIILAIERGEVAGVCGMSYSSMKLQRGKWLESKFIRPISQNHMTGDPAFTAQGIQKPADLVKLPEDRAVLELIYSQQVFGRPFVVAEGTPEPAIRTLRTAFAKVMRDPQLLAGAKKMGLDINPVSGEDLQAAVKKLYSTPPSIIRQAMEAMTFTQ
jgi:tripartite-type tricarboxylate transporter receptor subunit TctC